MLLLSSDITIRILPLHVLPSDASVYPLRHEHTKDPTVFLQLWSQRPREHSLMSEIYKGWSLELQS